MHLLHRRWFAGVLSASLPLWCASLAVGCSLFEKQADGDATGEATASASVASVAPSASASGTPAGGALEAYPKKKVEAGKLPDGSKSTAWVPSFTVERQLGNEGQTLAEALETCRKQGASLCTEPQWERACANDAKLGVLETWTLTSEDNSAVVRGGGTGCAARQTSDPKEKKDTRVAVCCERGVAITTRNENQSFLISSAKRLIDYENATQAGAPKLKELLDETVIYGGKETKQDQITKYYLTLPKEVFSVLDTCDVNIEEEESESLLISDCTYTAVDRGKFTLRHVRIVYGGKESKIQLIGHESQMHLLKKKGEKKERVRSFLGAD